jgi:hypothetical protein
MKSFPALAMKVHTPAISNFVIVQIVLHDLLKLIGNVHQEELAHQIRLPIVFAYEKRYISIASGCTIISSFTQLLKTE